MAPDHYQSKNVLEKQEFIEASVLCDLNFKIYEVVKFAMIGMLPLMPKNVEEERNAVLAALSHQQNIEHAIHSVIDQQGI